MCLVTTLLGRLLPTSLFVSLFVSLFITVDFHSYTFNTSKMKCATYSWPHILHEGTRETRAAAALGQRWLTAAEDCAGMLAPDWPVGSLMQDHGADVHTAASSPFLEINLHQVAGRAQLHTDSAG